MVFWGTILLLLLFYFRSRLEVDSPELVSKNTLVDDGLKPDLRVGYRGALIKWGISSPDEFDRARLNDPEIAEACQVGLLHPVILAQDIWRSVAYRQIPYEELNGSFQRGSTIFWTPLIRIPAGELVFEDREGNIVRGRCGNCARSSLPPFTMPPVPPYVDTMIAEFTPPEIIPAPMETIAFPPSTPLTPAPPAPALLPPALLPPEQTAGTPPEIPILPILPILAPPIIAGLPPSTPPGIPFVPLIPAANSPEPGTLMLLAGGLALLTIFRLLSSRRIARPE